MQISVCDRCRLPPLIYRPFKMINNVQVLRAVAAVLVVFVHLGEYLSVLGMPTFGYGGVDLFFVISGFVMVLAVWRQRPSPVSFVHSRVTRIVPLYWLLTLLLFATALGWPDVVRDSTDYSNINLAKSLLFIPFEKSNGLLQPVLFVGWTLNYEIFFYALFSCALLLRSQMASVVAVLSILATLVMLGHALRPTDPILAFYTSPYLLDFSMGMCVALLLNERQLTLRSVAAVHLAIMCFVCLVGVAALPVVFPAIPLPYTAGIVSAVLVTGAVALEAGGWRIRNVFILAVGSASYALYLTHPYITQCAEQISGRLAVGELGAAVFIPATLAVTIGAAMVVHRLVEVPLLRVFRRSPPPASASRIAVA